jgi:hypothetical protein
VPSRPRRRDDRFARRLDSGAAVVRRADPGLEAALIFPEIGESPSGGARNSPDVAVEAGFVLCQFEQEVFCSPCYLTHRVGMPVR